MSAEVKQMLAMNLEINLIKLEEEKAKVNAMKISLSKKKTTSFEYFS